jgi:hypothetical protein
MARGSSGVGSAAAAPRSAWWEIACRLTPFMNDEIIRDIETQNSECTLTHIVE